MMTENTQGRRRRSLFSSKQNGEQIKEYRSLISALAHRDTSEEPNYSDASHQLPENKQAFLESLPDLNQYYLVATDFLMKVQVHEKHIAYLGNWSQKTVNKIL